MKRLAALIEASNRRATSSAPPAIGGAQFGPRDGGLDLPRPRRHRGGPAIALDGFAIFHRATRSGPPRHRDLAECGRGLALDHALDIVEWRIRLAVGIAAKRMLGEMLAGVPAPDRQVEPAGEGHRIVDHDDLLMLGRSQRKAGVQAEPDPPIACRHELVGGIPFPLGRIQRGKIPDQDVDPQIRLGFRAGPSETGPARPAVRRRRGRTARPAAFQSECPSRGCAPAARPAAARPAARRNTRRRR